jgi:hypothetical protein
MRAIQRLSVSLAFCVVGAASAAAGPTTIGAIDKVQAQVDATQAGQSRALAANSDLYFLDRCRSGAGARMQATLKDGTKLTLGERATLVVDAFVYDPATSRGKLAVRFAKGAFLFVGGLVESVPGADVRIRTSAAAIGVRGTTVWGGPIDNGFGVLALSGEVTVTGRRGTVTLKQGEGTMLFADGRPRPVVTWPAAKVQRAIVTVSFGATPGGR